MDTYKEKYEAALSWMRELYPTFYGAIKEDAEHFFPELAEPDDEIVRKRLIDFFESLRVGHVTTKWEGLDIQSIIAYLEKQKATNEEGDFARGYDCGYECCLNSHGAEWFEKQKEPEWCHHKVDLSGCSEEYRKAYYDGWNNCNQQHSQLQAEQKEQIPYIDFVIKPHKGDDNNPYDMRVSEAQEYAIKRGFGFPFNDDDVYVDERHLTQTIGNILRWADEHPKEQKPVDKFQEYLNASPAERRKMNMDEILGDNKGHQKTPDALTTDSNKEADTSDCKYKNLDDIAQEYVDGVRQYNPEPTWDLIQTAVCYGYHLAEQKEQVAITDNGTPRSLADEFAEIERNNHEAEVKQDYSGLTDLERAVHRGFLCAGVKNVPVGIIKETARECHVQIKSAEWSEKDKMHLDRIQMVLESWDRSHTLFAGLPSTIPDDIDWLKSLRPQPHWKPSEDQMVALEYAAKNCAYSEYQDCLRELIEQLKKLM